MSIGNINTEQALANFIRQELERSSIGTLVRQLQGVGALTGNGSPENVVAAGVGTIYLRRDGGLASTLYVKESGSGNTGWTAK